MQIIILKGSELQHDCHIKVKCLSRRVYDYLSKRNMLI